MSPSPHTLQHLAIIMDGNRRWATERGLPKMLGHTEGAKNLKKITKIVHQAGIPYLTVYTLSTENLKNRSEEELKHLFSLLDQLSDYLGDFEAENTRVVILGDLSGLPQKNRTKLLDLQQKTAHHTSMTLNLAINYGGRDELRRAVQKIIANGVPADHITESTIENFLDTAGMPEVDLVIRTGGDQRLSNYLPWQTAYAELYFTPVYWPAFHEKELHTAIEWFYEQKRNKGK